jgi:hypothetical protein
MLRLNRSGTRNALLLICAAAMLLAAPAGAGQRNGSLELYRWKHVMDEGGHLWLAIQLTNKGNGPITVKGIAASAFGPWSDVSETAEPGQRIRAKLKTDSDPAEKPVDIWIYSTEGLAKFVLTKPS